MNLRQTLLRKPDATIDGVAWRRDGRAIAWADTPNCCEPGEVWMMNADGTGKRRILAYKGIGGPFRAIHGPVSWSRDGKRLAFCCFDGHLKVCTSKADGSARRVIANEHIALSEGAWSPTANLMAFVGSNNSSRHIYVGKPDGHELRRVTSGPHEDVDPAWSPDGKRLAFVRAPGDVYVVNADGTNLRNLTSKIDGAEMDSPSWSPDGEHIVFTRVWPDPCPLYHCYFDLYLVDADGKHPHELTHKEDNYYPTWSSLGPSSQAKSG